MTTEEARSTEVNITRTGRGRYGNAHIMYDVNDGLVDVILEVTPTEEQQAERNRDQREKKERTKNRQKRKNMKYEKNIDQDMTETHVIHAHNTPSQRKRRNDGTRRV
jgi:hypothetical protein